MTGPALKTALPGPRAKAIIERDANVVSTSYTRDYPLVIARGEGALVEDAHCGVGLIFRQDQGRREAERIAAGAENEQAPIEAFAHHAVALAGGALFGLPIANELNADHQAATSHIADDRVLLHQALHAGEHVRAHHLGVLHQPIAEQLQRRQ